MVEETFPSKFLEAKQRVKNALKNCVETHLLFERYPCSLFEGCNFKLIDDTEFGFLFLSDGDGRLKEFMAPITEVFALVEE